MSPDKTETTGDKNIHGCPLFGNEDNKKGGMPLHAAFVKNAYGN
jgi:hypothetical protein